MRRLIGEETGGRNIVDLRDRLVQRLETRLEKLSLSHRTVIAAAYENVSGTQELHRAVLSLIEPPDLSSFAQWLTREVPDSLGIEEARLCLEADVEKAGPAEGFAADLSDHVLTLPEGMVEDYLSPDSDEPAGPVVLREAGFEAELIFGEANPVQSEACLRLDIAGTPGMLVFGSADRRKFDASHGTDLLVFLAGVVERLLLHHLSREGEEG